MKVSALQSIILTEPITWILSTLVALLITHCCHSATIASSRLRHRQQQQQQQQLQRAGDDNSTASLQPPVDYTVEQHRSVQIRCDLNDTVNVLWLHNEVVVEGSSSSLGHRYNVDKETGSLYIANARLREDEGLWQCVDQEQSAARPVRLVVLESPRALYLVVDGRRLDPGNLFLPVKEDAELSVVCIVEGGHPTPSVAWYLSTPPDEVIALNSTELEVGGGGGDHTSSEAKLGRVQRLYHNATITCVVNHETLAASLNVSLLLDVQYTPSFGISRIPGFGFPLREGMSVSLRCDVDSNPPSSPVWVKDDGAPPVTQSGDGFLNFSAIRREHSGWYKCTSRHMLGEFSSIGYFLNIRYDPSEVTQDPGPGESTDVEVSLGGAVQLQCPTGVMGCWNRVSTAGKLEPVGPGPELTLDRVLYQEAGEYRCVAGKRDVYPRHWRESHQIKVSVVGRPVVYLSNKTLSAVTGQQLNLAVEFCANPPASRAIWLTSTKLLAPGDRSGNVVAHQISNGSSHHCHQAVLTVLGVTVGDQGEYVFLVRSPRGLAEGSVTVNVTSVANVVKSSSPRTALPTLCLPVLAAAHTFFYRR